MTLLNQDLIKKIRPLVLEGTQYKDIHTILEISPGTWDSWVWDNYQGFRDLLTQWKKERLIKKTEAISEEILDMDVNEDGRKDARLLSIKQKEAEFVRETLGKLDYSKRTEQTGANGAPLVISFDNTFNAPNTTPKTEGNNNLAS